MHRSSLLASLLVAVIAASAAAQVRVTPENSQGSTRYAQYAEPWVDIPDTFRDFGIPEWPVPTDLEKWTSDRLKVRQILFDCLGEMPKRPPAENLKILSREEREGFTLERFEFHNGVDMVVPGFLAIPTGLKGPVPVVIGMHGHSGSKNEYMPDMSNPRSLGGSLISRGFAVAAIDGYFNGERVGRGPRGKRDDAGQQEMNLFKLHLWQGRTLWGMMLRDEQCLLDYLETRKDLDASRIGATGMSMGCTRAWWLAAIDERVKAIVGVACFTRFEELLAHRSSHGIYYFVPGLLKHFDSEAIYSLVAPRPMLMLSGDQDYNAPPDGIEVLEKKIGAVYQLYGKPEAFRSVLYKNTGHEYLTEMRREMPDWFTQYLGASPKP
jgi:dienelactone hydrolase